MSIRKIEDAARYLYQQGLHTQFNRLSSGDCSKFLSELDQLRDEREQLKKERDTLQVRVGEMAAEVERLSDNPWEIACRKFFWGCSCSNPGHPEMCEEHTKAFHDHLRVLVDKYGVKVGEQCISGVIHETRT